MERYTFVQRDVTYVVPSVYDEVCNADYSPLFRVKLSVLIISRDNEYLYCQAG